MPPSPRIFSTRYLPSTTVPGTGSNRVGSAGGPTPSRLVADCTSGQILASIVVVRAKLREHAEVLEGGRVSLGVTPRSDVLQQPPHDLAAAGLRERVGEADRVGPGELADLLVDVRRERLFQLVARLLALLDRDEHDQRLPLQLIRPSDGRGLRHRGAAPEGALA